MPGCTSPYRFRSALCGILAPWKASDPRRPATHWNPGGSYLTSCPENSFHCMCQQRIRRRADDMRFSFCVPLALSGNPANANCRRREGDLRSNAWTIGCTGAYRGRACRHPPKISDHLRSYVSTEVGEACFANICRTCHNAPSQTNRFLAELAKHWLNVTSPATSHGLRSCPGLIRQPSPEQNNPESVWGLVAG